MTYQANPSAHVKVEYGFDVDQIAEGNYAPDPYHDFVGFEVSKPVLERAFARTYLLEMSSIFFWRIWPSAVIAMPLRVSFQR